jgi:hypothetical protein
MPYAVANALSGLVYNYPGIFSLFFLKRLNNVIRCQRLLRVDVLLLITLCFFALKGLKQ